MHLDLLAAHAPARPAAPQTMGADDVHDLRGDAGGARAAAEALDRLAGEAGLLLELAARGLDDVELLDQPRDPIDHARVDGAAVLLRQHDLAGVGHGDDRHRLLRALPLDELPAVALAHDDLLPFKNRSHMVSFADTPTSKVHHGTTHTACRSRSIPVRRRRLRRGDADLPLRRRRTGADPRGPLREDV